MFVLKTDFPSMFTRHPYFPLALHVHCRQGAALPKILGHKNGVMVFAPLAGRLAARPVGRSCPRRIKTFGDLICLMVDGFCGHTGSRRLRPSERARAAREEKCHPKCSFGPIQIFRLCSRPIPNFPRSFGKYIIQSSCRKS